MVSGTEDFEPSDPVALPVEIGDHVAAIDETDVVAVLQQGGLAVLPTDVGYVVAASAVAAERPERPAPMT